MLGCGYEEDSVYRFGRCSVFLRFVSTSRPRGLGIDPSLRSAEAFLFLLDMPDSDKLRLACGMYAVYRAVQSCRHSACPEALDVQQLMRIWARRAVEDCVPRRLLARE